MKIEWQYSIENEIGRLYYCATQIANGNFGRNKFPVLPYLPEKDSEQVVYFPDFKNIMTGSHWGYFKNVKRTDVPVFVYTFPAREIFEEQVKLDGLLTEKELSTLKKKWQAVESEVFALLEEVFLPEQLDIDKIIVYPVRYGTTGSYHYSEKDNIGHMYIRFDRDPDAIVNLILLCLIRKNFIPQLKKFSDRDMYTSNVFEQIVSIAAFLKKSTKLNEFFKNYQFFLPGMIDSNSDIARESNKYLTQMGFPPEPILKTDEHGLLVSPDGKKLANLSPQEREVLGYLVANHTKVITYEEIAEKIWGDDYLDKFSLHALNKLMHQIRFKLKVNGLSSIKIVTVRGQGYMLA